MKNNVIETILGAVVLIIAGLFLYFALSTANLNKVEGYNVSASFSSVDGITVGQDVKLSGVKIGSVEGIALDATTYLAQVTLSIDPAIKLPTDTVAKISSEGLLGGKFLALEPGAEEEFLNDGDKIQYTQSAVNLEELIGKFIFSGAEGDDEEGASSASADPFASDL